MLSNGKLAALQRAASTAARSLWVRLSLAGTMVTAMFSYLDVAERVSKSWADIVMFANTPYFKWLVGFALLAMLMKGLHDTALTIQAEEAETRRLADLNNAALLDEKKRIDREAHQQATKLYGLPFHIESMAYTRNEIHLIRNRIDILQKDFDVKINVVEQYLNNRMIEHVQSASESVNTGARLVFDELKKLSSKVDAISRSQEGSKPE